MITTGILLEKELIGRLSRQKYRQQRESFVYCKKKPVLPESKDRKEGQNA